MLNFSKKLRALFTYWLTIAKLVLRRRKSTEGGTAEDAVGFEDLCQESLLGQLCQLSDDHGWSCRLLERSFHFLAYQSDMASQQERSVGGCSSYSFKGSLWAQQVLRLNMRIAFGKAKQKEPAWQLIAQECGCAVSSTHISLVNRSGFGNR